MTHHFADESLSAFIDGDLDPATHSEIESHLIGCVKCYSKLEQLRCLVATLGTLPETPPGRDLWDEIRPNLVSVVAGRTARYRLLGAAASVILLVAFSTAWFFSREAAVSSELHTLRGLEQARAKGYQEAIRDMEHLIDEMQGLLDPKSLSMVRAEMATLDRAIVEIQQALHEDPNSLWLRERLARTLRDKWTYLREAPDLTPPRFIPEG